MNPVHITLNAKTPLSFRKGRDLAQAQTLDYVPGNALLGALAEAHQAINGDAAGFADFFLAGTVQYANLYPANFKADVLRSPAMPVFPLPLSARSCKRFSGFSFNSAAENETRHGVTDTLIPLLFFNLGHQTKFEIMDQATRCPICSEPLITFDGYYRRGLQSEQIGRSDTKSNHGLRTRTGIDYTTRTAAQGIFYSREVLLENSTFSGVCQVSNTALANWKSFVNKAVESDQIRVGNNRSRGLGLVKLNLGESVAEKREALEARVRKFNDFLRKKVQADAVDLQNLLYVPITLTSDAILYDNLLRPQLGLDQDYLSNRLGFANSQAVLQITGVRRITGWSTVWRMPKVDDLAIVMGSAFVITFREDSPQIFDKLWSLQNEGIGSRRTEGFGQLRVASEFHYEHLEIKGGFR